MTRTSNSTAENHVLAVIGSGRARSRRDIAQILNLSPSTVSQHVQSLLAQRLVEEGEARGSTGGRRAKELRLAGDADLIGAIDLGGAHARLAVVPRGKSLASSTEIPVTMSDGPRTVLTACVDELRRMAGAAPLAGVGIALPGPVDTNTRGVVSPSRMPGWADIDISTLLSEIAGVPAAVENDANAMAIGEHFAHSPSATASITVKAGTAIGAGIVIEGQTYRGAGGVAGDITHTRVSAAHDRQCSCGNRGCLETVASGAALVRLLQEEGVEVESTTDVLALVRDAHPVATRLARESGHHLGEVLCAVVNFFNPSALYVSGALTSLEPFMSALRSEIYEGSHPLMTRDLTIAPAALGADAALVGVAREVNELLARLTHG
ncbi:ROK family transcriptional regulator [Microbacterium halotolerans]|uniref:ROK family transcriptional regulator n=1 Tax=Microbacterium halotolerans TaxID=246613 RepID=UPI000E6AB5E8|nr:ROK family transcriptional regulator [Microbacterium halotolerans]